MAQLNLRAHYLPYGKVSGLIVPPDSLALAVQHVPDGGPDGEPCFCLWWQITLRVPSVKLMVVPVEGVGNHIVPDGQVFYQGAVERVLPMDVVHVFIIRDLTAEGIAPERWREVDKVVLLPGSTPRVQGDS